MKIIQRIQRKLDWLGIILSKYIEEKKVINHLINIIYKMLIYSFIFKSQSFKGQNEYKNRYIKILAEIYLLSYNFWPNEAV